MTKNLNTKIIGFNSFNYYNMVYYGKHAFFPNPKIHQTQKSLVNLGFTTPHVWFNMFYYNKIN
jgi:hypothetical protein